MVKIERCDVLIYTYNAKIYAGIVLRKLVNADDAKDIEYEVVDIKPDESDLTILNGKEIISKLTKAQVNKLLATCGDHLPEVKNLAEKISQVGKAIKTYNDWCNYVCAGDDTIAQVE